MSDKSCLACPSYVLAKDSTQVFKKSVGAPMCARFGHVLGKPGGNNMQERAIASSRASTCEAFGQPRPATPLEYRLEVFLPDPVVIERGDSGAIDPTAQARVGSCISCVNHIKDEAVSESYGWTAGACAAKGKLILPSRQTTESRGCDYREHGKGRDTTDGMMLLPLLDAGFSIGVLDPIKQYKEGQAHYVDPREYETDKPVTEDDLDTGIRAWRKVTDPQGTGNFVYLPIYDITKFEHEQQQKVPKSGDDEHPELYIDHLGLVYRTAVLWTKLDETPALWGVAGTGKTEFYRHMAWLMCLPFERISITNSTELDDLAGKMLLSKDEGTYFQYGRLPLAWQSPAVICLDEPNVGPPDVWQFIRPLTDNSKQMVLDMNRGEQISRHPDCYMGFAMNPAWDVRNVGAEQIGDADGSRLMHIFVDLPPEALEREIIRKRCALDGWEIPENALSTIMRIAVELRAMSEQGTLPITWGIRPQVKVARAWRWFEPVMAYRMASADYLEPESQAMMLDVVKTHVG